MPNHTSFYHSIRLRQALLPWLNTHNYTHFVTLAFNQKEFYRADARLGIARDKLKHFHAKLDDCLLGSKWHKKPAGERTFFIAFPEKISTNMHYHLLMRVHKQHESKFNVRGADIWKSVVKSGTFDCKPLEEAPNPDGYLTYASKEQYKHVNFDHVIISSEFLKS